MEPDRYIRCFGDRESAGRTLDLVLGDETDEHKGWGLVAFEGEGPQLTVVYPRDDGLWLHREESSKVSHDLRTQVLEFRLWSEVEDAGLRISPSAIKSDDLTGLLKGMNLKLVFAGGPSLEIDGRRLPHQGGLLTHDEHYEGAVNDVLVLVRMSAQHGVKTAVTAG